MSDHTKSTLYCSFCGKSQHEVRKLIAGPTVFICDECVGICNDIVRDEEESTPVGRLVPVRALVLLEHVPIHSIKKVLEDGGLKRGPRTNKPLTARMVLEAFIEGIDKARTRLGMTHERERAISDTSEELDKLSTQAQANYDRSANPLKNRLEALLRGEPLDRIGELTDFPKQPERPSVIPGLDTSIAVHIERRE